MCKTNVNNSRVMLQGGIVEIAEIVRPVWDVRHRAHSIEAVQFTWAPGTRTPKHRHYSRGVVKIQEGCLFEVKDGVKTYYMAGDTLLEVPNESIHIVGNDTNTLARSFHIYWPELAMDELPDDDADTAALAIPPPPELL